MKQRSAFLLFFQVAGLFVSLCAGETGAGGDTAAEDTEARLTKIEGTVYVRFHDFSEDEFVSVKENVPLEEGDLVRTGKNGSAEISLGGHSVIYLESNSDFRPESLKAKTLKLFLGVGRLTAKIRTMLEGEKVEIWTPICVAAVRGTELAVFHDSDDQPSRIAVFEEGRVVVRGWEGEEEVEVGPGQESDVAKGAPPARPQAHRLFLNHRPLVERVRQRRDFLQASWQRWPEARRHEERGRFSQLPRQPARRLNVRPDLRERRYQAPGHLPGRERGIHQPGPSREGRFDNRGHQEPGPSRGGRFENHDQRQPGPSREGRFENRPQGPDQPAERGIHPQDPGRNGGLRSHPSGPHQPARPQGDNHSPTRNNPARGGPPKDRR